LRKVEALAIQLLIEDIQEVVKEVAIISDEEKVGERLFEILTDEGPVMAKLLATRLVGSEDAFFGRFHRFSSCLPSQGSSRVGRIPNCPRPVTVWAWEKRAHGSRKKLANRTRS
jgi:hypothetical protein